jgi:hypothetical protein
LSARNEKKKMAINIMTKSTRQLNQNPPIRRGKIHQTFITDTQKSKNAVTNNELGIEKGQIYQLREKNKAIVIIQKKSKRREKSQMKPNCP